MTIAVGLSGGVDSSVAAWLLKQKGYTVIGATMKLVPAQEETTVAQARRVAKELGIPHYVIDLEKSYREIILSYIEDEYAKGRTPNPCVCCNRAIKFGLFLEELEKSCGPVDKMATGHYAGIAKKPDTGRLFIRQGSHRDKDQAYFLSLLSQNQLKRILFPLELLDKPTVRKIALEAGLSTFDSRESQDLCVGEYRQWINTGTPGEFITDTGLKLGAHKGIGNYTIGQRKGLGISHPVPLYVTRLDTTENRVYLSADEDKLMSETMIIGSVNWMGTAEPDKPLTFDRIKIRYTDTGEAGRLERPLGEGRWLVRFEHPRRAITPGQLAVFYQEDQVELAGIIVSASEP